MTETTTEIAAEQPADPATQDAGVTDPAPAEVTQSEGSQEAADKQTTESTEPAEYADFVVPEGVSLDQELTTEFKTIAKEMGLKQEQAQQLTDMAVKLSQKFEARQQQAMTEQRNAWEASAKSDPEFGGDKFNDNLQVAKKALEAFATPELINLLNATGLGSNPDMIRAFYRSGKMLSEDSLVPGTKAPETAGKTLAQKLYPNMN